MKEFGKLSKILKELHRSCQKEDGTEDQRKGTQLLEAYAIEIQMYTEQKNNKKLKELYQKALTIKSAIAHPKIMGIIRECGGKMHMAERRWEDAATDFFEAFKNYDEAGVPRRIQCLKYLVLANMLMESNVNPFDSQEAKSYQQDSEIIAMVQLVEAYQENNVREFERLLKFNQASIMKDTFIRMYVEDLLRNIRTQVLLKLIKPYTRIRIPFIANGLNIPEGDVEALLVGLILDNKISGHIDQVNQLLELGDRSVGNRKYAAVDKWAAQLASLNSSLVSAGIHVSVPCGHVNLLNASSASAGGREPGYAHDRRCLRSFRPRPRDTSAHKVHLGRGQACDGLADFVPPSPGRGKPCTGLPACSWEPILRRSEQGPRRAVFRAHLVARLLRAHRAGARASDARTSSSSGRGGWWAQLASCMGRAAASRWAFSAGTARLGRPAASRPSGTPASRARGRHARQLQAIPPLLQEDDFHTPQSEEHSWALFSDRVSGEWEALLLTFNQQGEVCEIPYQYVPEEFREWGVRLTEWQVQNSVLASPTLGSLVVGEVQAARGLPGMVSRVKRLLPTVGCEADAIAFEEETQITLRDSSIPTKSSCFFLLDGAYSAGPDVLERTSKNECKGKYRLEACFPLTNPGDEPQQPERMRVVTALKWNDRRSMFAFDSVELYREVRTSTQYDGGASLSGCGGGAVESFVKSPRLEVDSVLPVEPESLAVWRVRQSTTFSADVRNADGSFARQVSSSHQTPYSSGTGAAGLASLQSLVAESGLAREQAFSVLTCRDGSSGDDEEDGLHLYEPAKESWLLCMPKGMWATVSCGEVAACLALTAWSPTESHTWIVVVLGRTEISSLRRA
eukprot:scaffold1146_cov399-Prasinococcus_capsulatus_cf.AAC.52